VIRPAWKWVSISNRLKLGCVLVSALLFRSGAATAQEEAKRSELTPIAPRAQDSTRPAYQLYAETDLPLLGFGLVMASTRLFRSQPAYCAPLCDRTTLNALDRTTAGFYDTTWSLASDVGLISVMGGAALYLVLDDGPLSALNDAVVITESGLTAVAVSSLATVAAARPRPFLFGEKAPLDVRNSANASLSFVSSYSSATFAVAVSSYLTARRIHPLASQLVPALVLLTGLASATFVSIGQVEAGNHFITDIATGAIVGSASGILVPALHKSPLRIVPNITAREGGVQLLGAF
jgi:membrane-associated phospholipid phosphatase